MFTLDATIDAVQTGKKQFVKTFVTDEKIATALNEFIDNQSEYTKKAAKATLDAGTTVVQETIKHAQEAAKFDYVKFGEGIMKAYTLQTKTK
jgi:glycerate kinase